MAEIIPFPARPTRHLDPVLGVDVFWTSNDSACELCGEPFVDPFGNHGPSDRAEMFPTEVDHHSFIVHLTCGTTRNWEIA